MSYLYLFKYIIIGDSSVGKSAILLQFMENKFKKEHDTTIGVEFGSKIINIKNKNIKLQVWDTAGQESFKSITRSYYRGSICAFLVYDITNRQSFQNVANWLDEINNYSNEKITIILIGNKSDLGNNRQVQFQEGQQFADSFNIQFIETSAKQGENIELVFKKSTELVLNKIEKGEINPSNESNGVKVGPQQIDEKVNQQAESKCC
ncbi:Ras-related protein Rab-2 [Ichthyophthirius multifiliis]|uniref:Ras-related protein Rab-2 n=1 Tax=Ichthyophthirius multifiliis TaxID=5932 RepID=G0QKQ0_ICHMU|nr:Ras-related protein Rab-2 [Ichthyophthirius multifiliis]EGR34204.1 Ras-related protein Rab-2 [Ichthyophthirius multifiliis]|eukprot:XP_004039508.1 Ras-related protein Rab-2 [Ichthyophthirius multifiliis]